MDKVWCSASAWGKKPFKQYDVLAEEKVDEIGVLLEYSSLRHPPQNNPQQTEQVV